MSLTRLLRNSTTHKSMWLKPPSCAEPPFPHEVPRTLQRKGRPDVVDVPHLKTPFLKELLDNGCAGTHVSYELSPVAAAAALVHPTAPPSPGGLSVSLRARLVLCARWPPCHFFHPCSFPLVARQMLILPDLVISCSHKYSNSKCLDAVALAALGVRPDSNSQVRHHRLHSESPLPL